MKKSAKTALAATVTLMIINIVMQAIMPAGEVIMVIATMIILAGASRIVRQFDDLAAEKIFHRAVIAWGLFETIFGPTVLMLLIGAALAAYRYRKKNAAKEAAKEETVK